MTTVQLSVICLFTVLQLGRLSLRALQLSARTLSAAPVSVFTRASSAPMVSSSPSLPLRHFGVMDKVRETLSAQKDKKMNEKRREWGAVAVSGTAGLMVLEGGGALWATSCMPPLSLLRSWLRRPC